MDIGRFKIQVFGAGVEFKRPPVSLDSRTELTVPKEVETELSLGGRFLGRVGLFGPGSFRRRVDNCQEQDSHQDANAVSLGHGVRTGGPRQTDCTSSG